MLYLLNCTSIPTQTIPLQNLSIWAINCRFIYIAGYKLYANSLLLRGMSFQYTFAYNMKDPERKVRGPAFTVRRQRKPSRKKDFRHKIITGDEKWNIY